MQIYVCVKHVPDSAVNIKILDQNRIDESVPFLLNPYDEQAVTEALRVKETLPGSEIIAVCLGRSGAEKTLGSALAMGADRGILIVADKLCDSIETARALAAAIEQDGKPGLILTGKESIDTGGLQTMFRVGSLFDFPVISNAIRLTIDQDKAIVDSERSNGAIDTYELSLPCVIGAGRGLNTPRYPTFRDLMTARKKPIEQRTLAALGIDPPAAGMRIVELTPLVNNRTPKKIVGDAGVAAQKMAAILKQEAKVI